MNAESPSAVYLSVALFLQRLGIKSGDIVGERNARFVYLQGSRSFPFFWLLRQYSYLGHLSTLYLKSGVFKRL